MLKRSRWVPALVARKILIRGRFVPGRGLLAFLALCVALTGGQKAPLDH